MGLLRAESGLCFHCNFLTLKKHKEPLLDSYISLIIAAVFTIIPRADADILFPLSLRSLIYISLDLAKNASHASLLFDQKWELLIHAQVVASDLPLSKDSSQTEFQQQGLMCKSKFARF